MGYKKPRGARFDITNPNIPPEIHNVNAGGSPDPRFHGATFTVPAKEIANTKGDMELLRKYSHEWKFENRGKVCGECVYWYHDPNLGAKEGRCKFYGFKRVHEELTAEEKWNYVDPTGKVLFPYWPGCPTWTEKSRLSRH